MNAEDRLKRGELKALVATASLELGIDIGSVDLVCQLGSTRSISKFLQRVGRAEHKRSGLPKGRLFPLSRDELVESAALLRSIRRGELDCLRIPEKPLDILAQQIVAAVACEDWEEEKLFELVRRSWPYRNLTRTEFDDVVQMLATGFSTKRGRRAALIHYDAVNRRLHARRGSRLLALTSGGAIPDNTDYRVVLEPAETFIGTVNEDFAIESLPGDIFQLGNASWKILRVNSGQVRVEDAHGQPPSIPFWLGEAPGRTAELSGAVSQLREEIEALLRTQLPQSGHSETLLRSVPADHDLPHEPRTVCSPAFRRPSPVRQAEACTTNNKGFMGPTHELPSVPLLPGPHPRGEGMAGAALGEIAGSEGVQMRTTGLPLPEGEGWGEGEPSIIHSTTRLVSPHGPEETVASWLVSETGIPENAARQLASYFASIFKALGALPSQQTLVMERFFDESGGMQLVVHSPFGARINRAWGLALRKRFCRSFNFELQAAATDDAIVLSLGTQHSFPLDEVFRYLNSKSVREVLVQALLDAPMFTIRWRWNASRALAVPRQRGGRRLAAPLQRMESENLLAAVFPDQLACLENIPGDREVPDHPLVNQTVDDCLTEAMDIEGLEELLRGIEQGRVRCITRDLPEPSPLAHEILSARPYAFLDDAPLEERKTRAVYTRRALQGSSDNELGILDAAAIDQVAADAWPTARSEDELHEALLLLGLMTGAEIERAHGRQEAGSRDQAIVSSQPKTAGAENETLRRLVESKRAARVTDLPRVFWVAAERLRMVQAVYPNTGTEPLLTAPEARTRPGTVLPGERGEEQWERSNAIRELVRARTEFSGPVTARSLAELLCLPQPEIDAALLALEAEGFVLRGKFHPDATDLEWCERRLLARIHRLTINRLRAEIQPVSIQDYLRFLLEWQHVAHEHRVQGPEGLTAVIEQLEAFEAPVAAWEPDLFLARMAEYEPEWLDRAGFSGRMGWGRLTPPNNQRARPFTPLRTSPVAFFQRENLSDWLQLSPSTPLAELSAETQNLLELLQNGGALFFADLVRNSQLFPSHVEQSLIELIGLGLVTSDSFDGVRALLVPSDQRPTFGRNEGKRRHKKQLASIEFAGRWWLLREPVSDTNGPASAREADEQVTPSLRERAGVTGNRASPVSPASLAVRRSIERDAQALRESAVEKFAWTLLRRYGVVFRRLLERESMPMSWYELGKVYRSLEARGLIRGGHFISGVGGEQFTLPEAIGRLRSVRKATLQGELIAVSGADPLNLLGILAPGPRLPAIASNRLLFRDGLPVATLEAGQIHKLADEAEVDSSMLESVLKIGRLPVSLRAYY